jgi:AsmA protein
VAIPVKISGTFADPKYNLDYAAVATALAKSNVLDKVGGEKGAAVKEILGGDKIEGLKGLLGKKKPAVPVDPNAPAAPADGTTAAPAAPAAPAEAPKSVEDKAKDKLKKLLKF